jgi:hypothetical protein
MSHPLLLWISDCKAFCLLRGLDDWEEVPHSLTWVLGPDEESPLIYRDVFTFWFISNFQKPFLSILRFKPELTESRSRQWTRGDFPFPPPPNTHTHTHTHTMQLPGEDGQKQPGISPHIQSNRQHFHHDHYHHDRLVGLCIKDKCER